MDIFQICALGIIAVILISAIGRNTSYSIFISTAAGIIIMINVLPELAVCMDFIRSLSTYSGINSEYIKAVLKVTGIAYIAQFCSQICSDFGENALASKIELAAKIFIICVSMPIMTGLLNIIDSFL